MEKATQQNRILNAIRQSPIGITSRDMINMGIFKYSSRISELRQKGYNIVAHRVKKSLWRYTIDEVEVKHTEPGKAVHVQLDM